MREETFEYLRQAAAAGSWGLSTIELDADSLHPEAESEVTLSWRILRVDYGFDNQAEGGILSISSKGREERVAVPPVGRQIIHVGDSSVSVRLNMQGEGDESKVIILQPRIITPEIILNPLTEIVMGEVVTIAWETRNAAGTQMVVRNGEEIIFQGVVPPQGRIEVAARTLAPLEIHLRAWSRHAHLSANAVAVTAADVKVLPPPIRIELVDGERIKRGFIGSEVTFCWRITGAKESFLKAVEREEIITIPLSGFVGIEITDTEPEIFELIAVGFDGKKHVCELKVVPRLMDVASISAELQLLNANWEG